MIISITFFLNERENYGMVLKGVRWEGIGTWVQGWVERGGGGGRQDA